ncbi:MAG TPA: OadG family transporter subunit [Thermotogota bacterium]|nr:OadG family transporter subunit [Thermotogota bacterium]HRW93471.1 OadG family transporter subunit [Thermotogota bacterium]
MNGVDLNVWTIALVGVSVVFLAFVLLFFLFKILAFLFGEKRKPETAIPPTVEKGTGMPPLPRVEPPENQVAPSTIAACVAAIEASCGRRVRVLSVKRITLDSSWRNHRDRTFRTLGKGESAG